MTKKYCLGTKVLISGILLVITACDPVYIPDPIDPRLPQYTDKGNDVAGALINNMLWKSEYYHDIFSSIDEPAIRYYKDRDSLEISFRGQVENSEFLYRSISFGFRGFGVGSRYEMTKLNGKKITLDGIKGAASLDPVLNDCKKMGTGQLYLRSAKHSSDDQTITLSGTFGFTITDPICGNIEVTYGRFDFEIIYFYLI